MGGGFGFATAGSGQRRARNTESNSLSQNNILTAPELYKTQQSEAISITTNLSPAKTTTGPKYDLTVKQIVDQNLRVLPYGIELYYPPKIERAYLLQPQLGKQDKQKIRNFADIEAKQHAFVPGPIYNTMTDWSKDFPFGKGKFLKEARTVPEEVSKKKEKCTPSPGAYHPMEAWKNTEPTMHGNFKV